MESNVRRRRRDPAAGMPAQETQPVSQPQVESEQELSVQAQTLLPAYQRRQAVNRQMEQAVPMAQPVRRTVQNPYTAQQPAARPVQPVRQPAMEQSVYQRPVTQPVQTPVRSAPVQPAVRQRRAAASPVQIDDEPVRMQPAYVPESAQPEEEPVLRAAPARKKAEPKAALKKIGKKKEKPSAAAPAEHINYDEPIQLPRKKWVAFLLCLFGGVFGLHKFYERRIFKGILYVCTFGLAGFGVLIDLIALLRKPTVYTVEVKRRKPLLQAIRDFRFDIIGYIISGVGALILSLTIITPELRGAVMSPLVGAGVMLAGAALSFVYTRELVKVLIINGALLVGGFAFFFLWGLAIAIVVIEVVGLALGIDVFGTIVQLFSKDDSGKAGALHSVQSMPATILCDDGQRYHYVKGKAHASVYVGEQRKNTVTIHDNDINPGARSASVMGYVFRW